MPYGPYEGRKSTNLNLSPRERFFRVISERRLERCLPYLFGMADQVLADYPNRRWNLLIGDDTAGRLPTRFVRQVFKQAGVEIPTRYIAASKSVNKIKPFETFDNYSSEFLARGENPRALLVTEAAGPELSSIRFIHELISPYCETADTAIVSSKGTPGDGLGRVYAGAVGDDEAMGAIWLAFENPTGNRRIRPTWSGALNNLDINTNPDQAFAKRSTSLAYRGLSSYCYSRMNTLATEFWQQTHIDPKILVPEEVFND